MAHSYKVGCENNATVTQLNCNETKGEKCVEVNCKSQPCTPKCEGIQKHLISISITLRIRNLLETFFGYVRIIFFIQFLMG